MADIRCYKRAAGVATPTLVDDGDISIIAGLKREDSGAMNIAGTGDTNTTAMNIGTGSATTTITVGRSGQNTQVAGSLIVDENLTVSGTVTTVATTNLVVSDNLILLNDGNNGADSGIAIERGATGDDAVILWDEDADRFELGTADTSAGTSTPGAIATGEFASLGIGAGLTLDDGGAGSTSISSTSGDTLDVTATGAKLTLEATGTNDIGFSVNGSEEITLDQTAGALVFPNNFNIGSSGTDSPTTIFAGASSPASLSATELDFQGAGTIDVGAGLTIDAEDNSSILIAGNLQITCNEVQTADSGTAGNIFNVNPGQGAAAGATNAGGAGGAATINGGTGGLGSASNNDGGAGGATNILGGGGGTGATGVTGGAGGDVNITGGAGGAAGGGTQGDGGDVFVTAGSGATDGDINIGASNTNDINIGNTTDLNDIIMETDTDGQITFQSQGAASAIPVHNSGDTNGTVLVGFSATSIVGALNEVNASAGAITLQGAYDNDADGGDATITTNATDGRVVIAGTENLRITATGANQSNIAFDVDTTGAFSMDADLSSNINIAGNDAGALSLTIGVTNAGGGDGDIAISCDNDLTLDSTAGGFSIDGAATSNVSVTGAGLTVGTLTSGTLSLDSASGTIESNATKWDADGAFEVEASGAALTLDGATVEFHIAGSAQWEIDASGNLLASTDDTDDIGASGANRPQTVYVGTSVVVGDTVTITTDEIDFSGNGTVDVEGTLDFDIEGALSFAVDGNVTVTPDTAANATAGYDVTINSGQGGPAVGGTGGAGGDLSLIASQGGDGAAGQGGGAGGSISVTAGEGGAGFPGGQNGGAAGSITFTGGLGADGGGQLNGGSDGGTISLVGGAGGSEAGASDNNDGGSITLIGGAAGTGGSGTDGNDGSVNIGTSNTFQTIIGNTTDHDDVIMRTDSDGQITFQSQGAGSAVPVQASADTAGLTLDGGFSASSIVGALNELLTSTSAGAGAVTNSYTAGAGGITANRLVYISAADTILMADASAVGTAAVIGVAQATVAAAASVDVKSEGISDVGFDASLTLADGDEVFLSDTGGGLATNDVSGITASGSVILSIGFIKDDSAYGGTAGDLAEVHLVRGPKLVL